MTLQNRRETFETYNDGICRFCQMDDDGNAGDEVARLRYRERTVGSKRYYEAMTNKMQIDRLIRVQFQPWLTPEYLAVIDGEVFEIKQVQLIPDAKPRSQDVSLHLARHRSVTNGKA